MMPVSVRYMGDGVNVIWPIPFLFSSVEQVRVRRLLADGTERDLVYGSDFGILENRVVCPCAAGDGLVVWLEAPPQAQVLAPAGQAGSAGNGAVLASRAGVAASAVEEVAQAASGPEYGGELPQASRAVEEINAAAGQALEQGVAQLQEQAEVLLARIGACAEAERRRIERALGLCGSPLPAGEVITGRVLNPRDLLSFGPGYVVGSNTLLVIRNGAILAPGLDYEECGQPGEQSSQIVVLAAGMAADVWQIRVAALGSTQNAARASEQATDMQRKTAALAQASQQNARTAQEAEDASRKYRMQGEIQAEAARKSADLAHIGAVSAWQAAAQASIHATRPGISAVHAIEDIGHCSPGLFIINPHLTHAPTPFMGVWPAACISDMAWDACFLLAPLTPKTQGCPPNCRQNQ